MLQEKKRRWPEEVLMPLALVGFVLALFGTYWDDAWHTDKGRDSFLIPPHICLYAGISLVGAALAIEIGRRIRANGLRAVAEPAIALACVGVVVTLAAAPIDNVWHLAFGRDAVLWSPPHMLGVAGSLALAVGLLMLLVDAGRHRVLQLIAAAAVVAVGVIPVLEYDTDVPQFALVWFLPLLSFGSALGFGVARSLIGGRWTATAAAAAYTLLRMLIAAVLAVASLPVPLVPLLLLPALALDLSLQHTRSRVLAASAFAGVLFAAYVPYLNWVKSDIYIGVADVVVGLPLAIALAYVALLLAGQPEQALPMRARLATAAPLALALVVALSSTAHAHDPGQGEGAAPAHLTVTGDEEGAALTVDLGDSPYCQEYEPVGIVARRAGTEIESALTERQQCVFSGAVGLPDRGRWFVYGEFERGGEAAEAWLPVHVGDGDGGGETLEAERPLYYPSQVSDGPVKIIAGVIVYGFLLAVILAVARLSRRRVVDV